MRPRPSLNSGALTGALIGTLILGVAGPGAPRAVATSAGEAGVEAVAPDLQIRLSPAAVEKLIRAAVPYDIRLDVGVFTQVVRISEARDIRLFAGGITLKARATGAPVPLEAELSPVIRLERGAAGGYQVRVESLPVKVGWAGVFDLAGSIPVTPIEDLSEFVLSAPDRDIPVQLRVSGLTVDVTGILVEMQTTYP